jgi:hypothetical protein
MGYYACIPSPCLQLIQADQMGLNWIWHRWKSRKWRAAPDSRTTKAQSYERGGRPQRARLPLARPPHLTKPLLAEVPRADEPMARAGLRRSL